jgi:hypothetical protein
MQRGLNTVWTIHRSDRCIPASRVVVEVPVVAVFRRKSQQPRAWLEGEGIIAPIPGEPDAYAIVTVCDAEKLEGFLEDVI